MHAFSAPRRFASGLERVALRGPPFAIAGHTGASGSAPDNRRLSEPRAEAAHAHTVDRIAARGLGESRLRPDLPVDALASGVLRAECRRTTKKSRENENIDSFVYGEDPTAHMTIRLPPPLGQRR